jgi:hypothetical protein
MASALQDRLNQAMILSASAQLFQAAERLYEIARGF